MSDNERCPTCGRAGPGRWRARVVNEYLALRAEQPNATRQQIADVMGMEVGALNLALMRAAKAGDARVDVKSRRPGDPSRPGPRTQSREPAQPAIEEADRHA